MGVVTSVMILPTVASSHLSSLLPNRIRRFFLGCCHLAATFSLAGGDKGRQLSCRSLFLLINEWHLARGAKDHHHFQPTLGHKFLNALTCNYTQVIIPVTPRWLERKVENHNSRQEFASYMSSRHLRSQGRYKEMILIKPPGENSSWFSIKTIPVFILNQSQYMAI